MSTPGEDEDDGIPKPPPHILKMLGIVPPTAEEIDLQKRNAQAHQEANASRDKMLAEIEQVHFKLHERLATELGITARTNTSVVAEFSKMEDEFVRISNAYGNNLAKILFQYIADLATRMHQHHDRAHEIVNRLVPEVNDRPVPQIADDHETNSQDG